MQCALRAWNASCKLSWAKDKLTERERGEEREREREREREGQKEREDYVTAKTTLKSVLVCCLCVRAQLPVNSTCFCWAWEICKTVTPSPSWKIIRRSKIFAKFNFAKYYPSNERRSGTRTVRACSPYSLCWR